MRARKGLRYTGPEAADVARIPVRKDGLRTLFRLPLLYPIASIFVLLIIPSQNKTGQKVRTLRREFAQLL